MIHILSTRQQQFQGVRGLAGLNSDELFVFPEVGWGTGFTMRGVHFPIGIAFLDKDFKVISSKVMKEESGEAVAPPGSRYAVEGTTDLVSLLTDEVLNTIRGEVLGV
jgi:uncharacterized membrane protein (UPF0127 family)